MLLFEVLSIPIDCVFSSFSVKKKLLAHSKQSTNHEIQNSKKKLTLVAIINLLY